MNTVTDAAPADPPGVSSQQLLKALQAAVAAALERKRRLGHYAVFWEDGRPVAIGEDAPATDLQAAEPTPPFYGQTKPDG